MKSGKCPLDLYGILTSCVISDKTDAFITVAAKGQKSRSLQLLVFLNSEFTKPEAAKLQLVLNEKRPVGRVPVS